MNKAEIIDRLSKETGTNISRQEVLNWVTDMSDTQITHSLEKLYVGDVVRLKLVGGKIRPWVVLWVKGEQAGIASLTHDRHITNAVPCKCRFYRDGYIGPTLTVVNIERVLDAAMTPYSNKKHLKEVRGYIKSLWG